MTNAKRNKFLMACHRLFTLSIFFGIYISSYAMSNVSIASPNKNSTPPSVAKPSAAAAKGREPEAIYKQYCILCHEAGVAGAPKFRDKDDWQDRQKQGINTLMSHVIQGYNAMPAQGTCTDCTDEEIKSVIEYMQPK